MASTIKLNTVCGKLAHFLMTEAEDRAYSHAELKQIFDGLRTAGRVSFMGNGAVRVADLVHRQILRKVQADNDVVFYINKHISYTVV